MIPLQNRLLYEDILGRWRVMFDGRLVKQVFKTSTEAMSHLDALKSKKLQPEYVQ